MQESGRRMVTSETLAHGVASSAIDAYCGASEAGCAICGAGRGGGLAFTYAYQPILDVPARRIYAHEALIRGMQDEPANSVLSRVNDTNRYTFDQSCRVRAIELACDLGVIDRGEKLSINFLPHAIYRPEVCIQTSLTIARKRGLDVGSVIFEVTEGERVEDGPWFAEILHEYKRQGFLTAIDDFGAGYAGLRLLSDFQPDLIKLDMDLVRGVDAHRPRQAIARSVIRLAQELGIDLVAEGVETEGERDFFLHHGVRLFQGFLFSRPMFRNLANVQDCLQPQARP